MVARREGEASARAVRRSVSALGRSAGWSHVAKAKRALARFVEAFPLSDGALRHSHVDARMTANIYTKLVGEDVREAIAKLPTL